MQLFIDQALISLSRSPRADRLVSSHIEAGSTLESVGPVQCHDLAGVSRLTVWLEPNTLYEWVVSAYDEQGRVRIYPSSSGTGTPLFDSHAIEGTGFIDRCIANTTTWSGLLDNPSGVRLPRSFVCNANALMIRPIGNI